MRRTAIRPARMHELAREFLGKKKVVVNHDKGGRPREYDDALILTIACKQGRLRKKINDPLRMISKKNADNPKVYRKRTLVEGMFGNVKQKLSSHIKIFRLDIAQTFALLRFALFNMAILASLENARLLWLWFSNSLRGML